MNERYCANPDHIRTCGRDAPSLTFSDEDCFYRDSDEPGYECVAAVLVPVTQRQAEQRVIEAAKRVEIIRLGRGISVRGVEELSDALDALAAVQDIPVDTEAGNG